MDRALRTPEVNARRAKLCEGLYGRVLEVGFGTGLNLRHYPSEVTEILIVEPSASAMRLAELTWRRHYWRFIEYSNQTVCCIFWSTGRHRRNPYAVGSAGCIRFIAASPRVAISTGPSII